MKKFHKPLDLMFVTQPFAVNYYKKGGYSFQPCNKLDLHTGVDLRAYIGRNIYAPADGVVIGEGGHKDWRGGLFVSILVREEDEGAVVYNGHNSKNLVKDGEEVKRGQRIALSGNTGNVAPHVHHSIMPITYYGEGKWDYKVTHEGNKLCGKVDPMTYYDIFQPSKSDPVMTRYGRRDYIKALIEFAPHFLWLLGQPKTWKKVQGMRRFNALKWGNWELREVLDPELEHVWSQITRSEWIKRGYKL